METDNEKFNAYLLTILKSIPRGREKEYGDQVESLLKRAYKTGLGDGDTASMFAQFKAGYDPAMRKRYDQVYDAEGNRKKDKSGKLPPPPGRGKLSLPGGSPGAMSSIAAWNASKVAGQGGYDPLGKLAASILNAPIAVASNWIGGSPKMARDVIGSANPEDPLSMLTGAGAITPTISAAANLRAGIVGSRVGSAVLGKLGPAGALLGGIGGAFLPMLPGIQKPIEHGVEAVENFLYGDEGGKASRDIRAQRMQADPILGLLNESTLPLLMTGRIDPAHLKGEAQTAAELLSRRGAGLINTARRAGGATPSPQSLQAMQRLTSLGNTAAMTAMGINSAPEGTGALGHILGGLQGLVSTPTKMLGPIDRAFGIHSPPRGESMFAPPPPRVASMHPQGQEITPPSHQLPPGPTDGQIMGDGFVMRPAGANPTHAYADSAAPSTPPPVSPGGMFPDFPSAMGLTIGQYAPRAEASPPMPTTSVDRPRRTYAAPIDPAEAIPAQTPVEGRAPISTEEALRFAAGPTLGKRPVVVKPPARKWRPYKPGPRRIGTTENPNVREEASPVVEAPSTPKPMPAPVEVKSPAETPVAPPAAKPDTSSPPPRSKEDAQQSVDDLRDFIESDTQGTAKPKTDASFSVQDAANVHEDLTAAGRQVLELKDGNWIGYVGEIEKNGKKYTVIAQGTHGKGGLTFHYSEVPSKAATTPESATSKKKVVETPKAETPQSDTSNVRNTDHAAADRLESRMADADVEAVNSGKPYVKKLAAQLFKEGVIDKSTLDEVNRVASDRDMDGGDVLDVFKSDVYDHIDRLRGKDGLKPPPTDAQIEAQMKEREAFNRRTDERLSEGSNVRENAATDDAAEKLKQRKAQQSLEADQAAYSRVAKVISETNARIKTLNKLLDEHLAASKGASTPEIEALRDEISDLTESKKTATTERSRLSTRISRAGGNPQVNVRTGEAIDSHAEALKRDAAEVRAAIETQERGTPTVTKADQSTYHERPLSRLMPGRKIDGDGGWSVFYVEPAAKADSGTKMLAHGGDRLTGWNKPAEYVPYRENSVNVRIRRPGQRDLVVFGAGVDANGDIVLHDGSKLIVEKPQTAESIAKKNKQIAEGGPNKGC